LTGEDGVQAALDELPEQFTKEEVEEYTIYLGMDVKEDQDLLYIAEA